MAFFFSFIFLPEECRDSFDNHKSIKINNKQYFLTLKLRARRHKKLPGFFFCRFLTVKGTGHKCREPTLPSSHRNVAGE